MEEYKLKPLPKRLKAARRAEKKNKLFRLLVSPIRFVYKNKIRLLLIACAGFGTKGAYEYFNGDKQEELKAPYGIVDIIPSGQQYLTISEIEEFLKELRNTKAFITVNINQGMEPEDARKSTLKAILATIDVQKAEELDIKPTDGKLAIDDIVEATLAQDDRDDLNEEAGIDGFGREAVIAENLTLEGMDYVEGKLITEKDAKILNGEK